MAKISFGPYTLSLHRTGSTQEEPAAQPPAPIVAPRQIAKPPVIKPHASGAPFKMHLGPGRHWVKPDDTWLTVDVDPDRGDIVANFNEDFAGFPLKDNSVSCIYASHTFEHISIFKIQQVMSECFRVLTPGGVLRVIVPDPVRSMKEYLNGNANFLLFKRRIRRAKKKQGIDYTIFQALREDFISPASQQTLLGGGSLAHQNAWDFEAMQAELSRAGFAKTRVVRKGFKNTDCADFAFEGTYPSEANEDYRSMYVEATK